MKKFLMFLAFVGIATVASAEGTTAVPTQKYHVVTNSFWANWYVQAGFSVNASYTSQENHDVSKNPFTGTRGAMGFDVAVGKWFTPGLGLRTKFHGLWAKNVCNVGHDAGNRPVENYYNIEEDVMFNLSNLFCGYNEKRVWNFIIYPGIGYHHNYTVGRGDLSLNVGIMNTWRLCKHWNIFLDIWGVATEGSQYKDVTGANPDNWQKYSKARSRHWDKMIGATLGVTWNLGKCTWEKAPDVDGLIAMYQGQIDALNAALKEQQDENARLRELLANQKPVQAPAEVKTVVEKQYVNLPNSVFFNVNSTKIASRKDLVNVEALANYAKENGSKVLVKGYADSKTGTEAINNKLAEGRANAVVDELVKMGVNRDNIEVVNCGGVDSLAPFTYNRRATVELK